MGVSCVRIGGATKNERNLETAGCSGPPYNPWPCRNLWRKQSQSSLAYPIEARPTPKRESAGAGEVSASRIARSRCRLEAYMWSTEAKGAIADTDAPAASKGKAGISFMLSRAEGRETDRSTFSALR